MLDTAAATPPDPTISETRDFALGGDILRFSLEASYWRALEAIATREGMSLVELIKSLRIRVARGINIKANDVPTHMLVSGIHVMVVSYFRQAAVRTGPMLAEEALMDMAGEMPNQTNQ